MSRRDTSAFGGYAKGSIVVCPDCWHPVYVLERGIGPLDRAGRAASAFRPLTRADCAGLLERPDVDAGWRRLFGAWCETPAVRKLFDAPRPKAGDLMTCPLCEDGVYGRFTAETRAEFMDRAYVLQLTTIAPLRATPTPWLGRVTRWACDPDPSVTVEVA